MSDLLVYLVKKFPSTSTKRITRAQKKQIKMKFEIDDDKIVRKVNWTEVFVAKKAVNFVSVQRKKHIHQRAKNLTCPISLKKLKECSSVFKYVQEDGFVRGYDATSLATYFSKVEEAKDPITRKHYSSLELRRLSKQVNAKLSRGILDKRISFWRSVFLKATQTMISNLMPALKAEQLNDTISTFQNDRRSPMSSFLCQASYLYSISKPKYRSMKRHFIKHAIDKRHAKQTLSFLDNICFNLFRFHEIVFAFKGERAVPMLVNVGANKNLIN